MLKIKLLIILFSLFILFLFTGCPMGRGYEPPPYLSGSITVSGSALVGHTLTVNIDNLGGSGTISYQWRRGGNQNIGANSNSYNISVDDIGFSITVTVRRSGNTGSITTAPTNIVTDPTLPALTGTVTITGTAEVGQTLTANTTGLGGSGMISYQWRRDDSDVIGTNNSYTLQEADVGSTITVTVTRSGNSGSITSAATGTIVLCFHIFSLWQETTAPTCTAAGEETEKCSKCGELGTNKRVGTNALGHDHISSLICRRIGCDHQYALGDTGPAGGIIFYVAPDGFTMTDDNSTAYYLEAAPANMSTTLRWSTLTFEEFVADNSLSIDIPGTGTAIGTGRRNTALILALDPTAPAALACRSYFVADYESFNDWFLPSGNELNQLYIRRVYFGLSSGWFWSSSQSMGSVTFGRGFNDGISQVDNKGRSNDVRAIRAF